MESRMGIWIAVLVTVIGAAQVSSSGTKSSGANSDASRPDAPGSGYEGSEYEGSEAEAGYEAHDSDGQTSATRTPEVMPDWYNPIAPLREFLEETPRYQLEDFLNDPEPDSKVKPPSTVERWMALLSKQFSNLWREFKRVRASIAGKGAVTDKSDKPDPAARAAENPAASRLGKRLAQHNCEFIIATVADPLNSRFGSLFDSQVAAIQQAAADAGWHLDRYVFPWSLPSYADERAGRRIRSKRFYRSAALARQVPGMILFRKSPITKDKTENAPDTKKPPDLLIVFLVGETATYGIHHQPFLTALNFIEWSRKRQCSQGQTLSENEKEDSEYREYRILGPTFSGAQQSLEHLISSWSCTRTSCRKNPGKDSEACRFLIYSGGATSIDIDRPPDNGEEPHGFQSRCKPADVTFHSTVAPDRKTLPTLIGYLAERCGGKIACLVESGTGYGAGARETFKTFGEQNLEKKPPPQVVQIPFPMHISLVRGVATRKGRSRTTPELLSELQADPYGIPIPFDDDGNTRDIIPPFSPSLTAASEDLVLGQILATLEQESFNLVGIMASDLRDQVFLAQLIHNRCPHAQLFTTGANLLQTHHQFNVDLRGMLVATTYPLHPRTQSPTWKKLAHPQWPEDPTEKSEPPCDTPPEKQPEKQSAKPHQRRQQFFGETLQGTYNAMLALLGKDQLMLDYDDAGIPEEVVTEHRKTGCDGKADAGTHGRHPPLWISVVGRDGVYPLDLRPICDSDHYMYETCAVQSKSASKSSSAVPSAVPQEAPPQAWWQILWNRGSHGERSPFLFLSLAFFCFVVYTLGTALPQSAVFERLRARGARKLGRSVPDKQPPLSAATAVTALPVGDSQPVSAVQRRLRKWCSSRWMGMLQRDFFAALCLFPSLVVMALLVAAYCTVGWNYWELRTTNLSSGLSIAIPAVCIAGVLYLWGEMHLKRRHAVARDLLPIPFPVTDEATRPEVAKRFGKVVKRCREVEIEMQHPFLSGLLMYRMWNGDKANANERQGNIKEGRWNAIGLGIAGLLTAILSARCLQFRPTLESPGTNGFLWVCLVGSLALLVLTAFQFYALWARIQRVCERIAELRMLSAFDRLPQVMSNVLGRLMSASRQAELHRQIALQQCRRFSGISGNRPQRDLELAVTSRQYLQKLEPLWDQLPIHLAYSNFTAGGQPMPSEPPDRPQEQGIDRPPEIAEADRLAMEDFVAIQIIRYLAPLFVQLRNLRTFLIVAPLLLLVAFGSYPFHIRGMLPILWMTTLGIIGIVMLVFVQIECNELVSRISRTPPNRLTFDRTFWSSMVICLAPLATFLAWQFQGMSGTLSSWIESLMN